MRLSPSAAALVAALVLASPAAAQDRALTTKVHDFDVYAAKAVADWKVPGLAVALVKDGKVVFAKGYGVRQIGRPEPVTTRTLFAIGSTTKAMTAAALGILVDEGKVRWDDPVTRHLPAFVVNDPYVTREVTVRDLLTHRAGMPETDFLWYRTTLTPADVLKRLAFVKPETSMRSHFQYQNVMYHAAGEVLHAAGGTPWPDFLRQRIFTPLGMADTVPTATAIPAQADVAAPHFEIAGTVKVIKNATVDSVAPAGSVWSSIDDMAKWVTFLLNGGRKDDKALLAEATVAELFTPQAIVGRDGFYPTARLTKPKWTTYGLGWFQQDYAGRAVDFHTGSIDGMVAICGLIREERLGVMVLANLDHAEVRHALMLRAFDLFGAGPRRDWSADLKALYAELRSDGQAKEAKLEEGRVASTRPTLALAAYAGTYEDPLFGEVKVSQDGEALRMEQTPELRGRLDHWNYDTFKMRFDLEWLDPVYVRFGLDAQGRPASLFVGGLGAPDAQWTRFQKRADTK